VLPSLGATAGGLAAISPDPKGPPQVAMS